MKGESIMSNALQGKKVAILVTDGFEQVELTKPRQALPEAGADTKVVSPKGGKVKGWNHKEWGDEIPVDLDLRSTDPSQFDALLLSRRRNESRQPSHGSLRGAVRPAFL
jgi:protease I